MIRKFRIITPTQTKVLELDDLDKKQVTAKIIDAAKEIAAGKEIISSYGYEVECISGWRQMEYLPTSYELNLVYEIILRDSKYIINNNLDITGFIHDTMDGIDMMAAIKTAADKMLAEGNKLIHTSDGLSTDFITVTDDDWENFVWPQKGNKGILAIFNYVFHDGPISLDGNKWLYNVTFTFDISSDIFIIQDFNEKEDLPF